MTAKFAGARPGWVTYATLLTFGVLAGEARNVSTSGEIAALTLANWVLSAALLTALWGYAMQRAIGNPAYWRAAFWLVLLANGVMLVPVLLAGGAVVWFTGALTLLIVPAYVATYRYGYRSPAIWAAINRS
jgi:hypothetical protein